MIIPERHTIYNVKAPTGTLRVLDILNNRKSGNRIPMHELIEGAEISTSELDTVFEYLKSRGAVLNYRKTDELGGLYVEVQVQPNVGDFARLFDRSTYDSETNTLFFAGSEINIGAPGKNLPAELLRTIFKDPKKEWANDAVFEDWAYSVEEYKGGAEAKRVYHAGKSINAAVERKTGKKDFLIVSTRAVRLNPKYL